MQIIKLIHKGIAEFINNDLSITSLICATQVFNCYLCGIRYKKNCFFLKNL